MGKKKKHQFIDKKSAHKFSLVHRSQRDPLQADEHAGDHVLMPIDNPTEEGDITDPSNMTKEEKAKYGITYDDDYDYMQHLRPRGEGFLVLADNPDPLSRTEFTLKGDGDDESTEDVSFGNIKLPSGVFASAQEEDIGMLNKGVLPRGPQPDWDPDIVQALDDDVDFEDPDMFLDDDFISKANADGGYDGCNDLSEGLFSEQRDPSERGIFSQQRQQDKKDNDDDGEWETASEDGSYISSDNLMSGDELDDFADEETKTRFTNYSMTSSIIRRTEGLKVLDDRFERIMEEYDEVEIGCIEQEEVQGVLNVNNQLINNVIDDFYQSNKKHPFSETKAESGDEVKIDEDLMNEAEEEGGDEDEKLFTEFMKEEPKEKWDCESIISTYSNIYNHPKLIEEESKRPLPKKYELHKRTGIPIGVFDKNEDGDDAEDEEDLDDQDIVIETVVLNNVRNKGETPEERKQRKKDVKEQRKNRRIEKKTNKIAFKYEQKKQEKVNNNTVVQKSIQKL